MTNREYHADGLAFAAKLLEQLSGRANHFNDLTEPRQAILVTNALNNINFARRFLIEEQKALEVMFGEMARDGD